MKILKISILLGLFGCFCSGLNISKLPQQEQDYIRGETICIEYNASQTNCIMILLDKKLLLENEIPDFLN